MSSKSIEQMMSELAEEGIIPEKNNTNTEAINNDSFEDRIIKDIERVSKKKFSEEQLKILRHKGSSCVVACAGSGKTSTTISLIAKRIISKEIVDVTKLVYITYSKSGAEEMKTRLQLLLKNLGLNISINVQTIHAFFLHIIRTFGVKSNVISNGERSAIIREACKHNGIINRDDEAETVNNLLSYQVNNLLSDKEAVESTVNTLEELNEEKFKAIREYYALKKMEKHLIDYDDMQQYLYFWMITCKNSTDADKSNMAKSISNYCKAVYSDFYIDEAQDVSKIQYAIIREMVSVDGKLYRNLTFIGDDDQCLIEGTEIITSDGIKNIEDIQPWDKVLSGVGHGIAEFCTVDNMSVKEINEDIYVLKTKSGKIIKGTSNHIGFAKLVPVENMYYTYLMYRHDIGFRIGTTSGVRAGNRREKRNGIDVRLMQERSDKVWIIKETTSLEESRYYEAYYAYKYSIPMYRFVTSDTGKGIPETTLSYENVKRLHREINTFENGLRLLDDLNMYYEYPHRIPQAEGERCKINHSLFSSCQISKYGMHKSELSINTSNQDYINTFNDILSITDRSTKTKYNYKNARNTSDDIDSQLEIIKTIEERCKNNGIYLEVDSDAKLTENKFKCTPFSHMRVGMIIPVINTISIPNETIYEVIDDEIIEVSKERYNGKVYDLSVPDTRNFSANNIIVHNCIYEWRGSDPSIILGIASEFNISTFMLSTNYRCKDKILKFASKGIQYNEARYEKEMQSIKEDGEVEIAISENMDMLSLSKIAMTEIENLINNGNKYTDIAILVRNNLHAAILSNMLLRKGIYVLQADNMKLTKSYGFKCIKDLIDLTSKNKEYDHALMSKSLWGLCRYMGLKNSNLIGKFMRDNGLTILDTLGYLNKQFGNKYDIQFDKNVLINNASIANMGYMFNKFSFETREDLVKVYNALKLALEGGNRVDAIKTLIWMYIEASSFLFKAPDKKRYMQGLASYIIRLIQEDGFDKAMELLRVTEQLEGGNMVIPGDKIVLSTIHGAKGREWKNVIMLASDTISQPSYDRINKMIDDKIPINAISREIDEERRLFYVGCTRAINRLLIITYKDTSPFILEAIGAIEENKLNNMKIIEMACKVVYDGKSEDEIEEINRKKQFVDKKILDEIIKKNGKYYHKGNEKLDKESKIDKDTSKEQSE